MSERLDLELVEGVEMGTKPPAAPHGLAAIIATFGNPFLFTDEKLRWMSGTLATVPLKTLLPYAYGPLTLISRVTAHRLIADELAGALQECITSGVPPERLVYGGSYCWRAKRGGSMQLSAHTWGIAVDLDPGNNPQGKKWTAGDARMLDRRIIDTFLSRGWTWGDGFPTPDPMHFQFCTGY